MLIMTFSLLLTDFESIKKKPRASLPLFLVKKKTRNSSHMYIVYIIRNGKVTKENGVPVYALELFSIVPSSRLCVLASLPIVTRH